MNYKLSPSELTYLYNGCKFCFWLKVKHGIPQPSMPMPGIFSAIAGSQKEFYADKRTEEFCGELPPGVVEYNEQWVQSGIIEFKEGQSCYIKGRFDCVVRFDDKSYGVIDFKTASPSDEKAEMYGRQLGAYAFALENADKGNLSLKPVTKLGLLFFEPSGFAQLGTNKQAFTGNTRWVEVKRDDEKFLVFIKEVMGVLVSEEPPQSAGNCAWCAYRKKTKDMNFKELLQSARQQTAAPLCPKCNNPMQLRKGKFGEFWSCPKYPECRGTRNL